jgi:hypothetical protein
MNNNKNFFQTNQLKYKRSNAFSFKPNQTKRAIQENFVRRNSLLNKVEKLHLFV